MDDSEIGRRSKDEVLYLTPDEDRLALEREDHITDCYEVIKEKDAQIARLTAYVDFVLLWCTRARGKMTDAERVSAILHHPTAQARSKER